MEDTTIRVSNGTKSKLDSLKVHPRQSYDELLGNLAGEEEAKRAAKKAKIELFERLKANPPNCPEGHATRFVGPRDSRGLFIMSPSFLESPDVEFLLAFDCDKCSTRFLRRLDELQDNKIKVKAK